MLIDVETYLDEKRSLVDVEKLQEGKVHRSVPTNRDEIITYEEISENDPFWTILIFGDAKEYLEAIKKVDWIMEEISKEALETIENLIIEE
mgnify:CR=1 FL=1